jgi:aspartate/tyrosine/aromatic aminotransferase
MFGEESSILRAKKVHSIQAVAGTGSLRLGMDFLRSCFPDRHCIIPDVTWPNHLVLLKAAGIPFTTYRYLDSTGCGLDYAGMLADIKSCAEGSVVLFHSCAHNPSGVDPSEDQWRELLSVVIERRLFPLFDNAYQGFVTGDPEVDAFAVRLFAEAGVEMLVCCR